MNQEAVVHHIGDGCYTDQGGVHTIDGLQLHSYLETTLHIDLENQGKRYLLWCAVEPLVKIFRL